MRIAIPTEGKGSLDDLLSDHFGRCKTFTIVDENGNFIEGIDNIGTHMGGSLLPPEILKKHDVDVLLCRDLGIKALNLFNNFGIKVCTGDAKTARDIFEQWKSNKITDANVNDVCKGHER